MAQKPSSVIKYPKICYISIFIHFIKICTVLQPKKGQRNTSSLHWRIFFVDTQKITTGSTCNFLFKKVFGEIGTDPTCEITIFEDTTFSKNRYCISIENIFITCQIFYLILCFLKACCCFPDFRTFIVHYYAS